MNRKRIVAALAALSLLLCGCQSKERYDADYNVEGSQMDMDGDHVIPVEGDELTNIVRTEELPLPESMTASAWNFVPTAEGFACIGNAGYDGTQIFRFHTDTSEWTEIMLEPLASYDGYYFMGGLVDFGEDVYYQLAVMENHSNMEPYSDGDENFDWDTYNESFESDYYLCTYQADGTLAEKMKIEGLEDYKSWQGYDQFSALLCEKGNNYLALQDGAILRIGEDGTLTEIRQADGGEEFTYPVFLRDRDGNTVFYESTDDPSVDYVKTITTLYEFDANAGTIGEAFYSNENSDAFGRVMISGGFGDYRLFINEAETTSAGTSSDKLYGIKDDGTKEIVIDWDASNMDGIDVTALSDSTFIGYDAEGRLCRISRKYASEIKEKQIITIGSLGDEFYIKDFTREFNNTHDDYQLNIITYPNSDGSYFGDPEGKNDALDNLKLAITGDDAPDLVFMQGDGSDYHDTFLRLGARGVFCDLYELLNEDDTVNRDTLLPNILTAMQHPNGSLYSLTSGFTVQSIAVKSKFTDKENWTMDDMIELYEGADDIMYYWSTKQDMLKLLLTGTDFTDEVNGTCYFDSPEFIRMLEFCDRYPAETTEPEKSYDDPEQEAKWQKWLTDNYHRYQEDTDYLYGVGFSGFTGEATMASSWAYTKADLGGDFTLVGYPSDNGKGGKIVANGEIAISTNCTDKAAAWEVVKSYLQYGAMSGTGYSIFNERFEELLDNEMYIWEMGERSDAEYYDDDSRVYRLTQEERDRLETYIRSCDTYMMLDEKVEAIVYEEAGMYFSGDRSAEETAEMIQSRAELYLAEQS